MPPVSLGGARASILGRWPYKSLKNRMPRDCQLGLRMLATCLRGSLLKAKL